MRHRLLALADIAEGPYEVRVAPHFAQPIPHGDVSIGVFTLER